MISEPEMCVRFFYKNWRGESAWRRVKPISIWYGSTEHHKESQWLLRAYDWDRNDFRDFAMSCISEWMGEPNVAGLPDY